MMILIIKSKKIWTLSALRNVIRCPPNICLQITMKYTRLFNPIVVMFHAALPPYLIESPPLSPPPLAEN